MLYNERVMRSMLGLPKLKEIWENRPKGSTDYSSGFLRKTFFQTVIHDSFLSSQYQIYYGQVVDLPYEDADVRDVKALIKGMGWVRFLGALINVMRNNRIIYDHVKDTDTVAKYRKIEEKLKSFPKKLPACYTTRAP